MFDGVAISTDGAHWYEIQALRGLSNGTWTQFAVDLDAAIASRGLSFTSDFRIRFSHYGAGAPPSDGIAIDEVSITSGVLSRLSLTLPASISESAAPASGTVALPAATGADTVLTLVSSSPQILAVPASVTIPAGETSAAFSITPIDNPAATGPMNVAVTASASGWIRTGVMEVTDDEAVTLSLSIPSPVEEFYGTVDATLTMSPPSLAPRACHAL